MENVLPILFTISILIFIVVPMIFAVVAGLIGHAFDGWHGFFSLAGKIYLRAFVLCGSALLLIWGIGTLGVIIYRLVS